MAVITGMTGALWWAAAASPAASAQAVSQPAAGRAIRAAAAGPAPLVRDVGPAGGKQGLGAPAMSLPMLQVNAERQVRALQFVRTLRQKGSPDLKCTRRPCRAGLPAARDLRPTQQAQVRGYYCGPATVSEMLAQLGKRVSQATAARELRTNPSGTNWSDNSGYPVPAVLNLNQKKNNYVAVALPWYPTSRQITTFEADLVTDVNHNGGVPLAGNAYEVAGGPHLVGSPVSQTIFHWFEIRGYQKFGAVTDYEDSVHGAPSIGWSVAVPAYSSMPSSAIVDILGARGYDW
ncbi:MAG TPA: C39 family peptidase [Streptosporangiaceae bacterium]|jgi:hypothetical protein